MLTEHWRAWPSREALSRTWRSGPRRRLAWVSRVLIAGVLLWVVLSRTEVRGWQVSWLAAGAVSATGLMRIYYRTTLERRLWPSVAVLLTLLAGAVAAELAHERFAATVLVLATVVVALGRMPLTAAVPLVGTALALYSVLISTDNWVTTVLTGGGMTLIGYVSRLDREARGASERLLTQERAARAAEAESAAMAERARIAREIHDVLAHSLSAQTVHLEATRMLIERGAPKDEVLQRVVAARRMAREGLAETRQALSALRGEMAPVEEFLRELIRDESATMEVDGEPRLVTAEAGLAVRRVAQEAMTNVRKHAPGAKVEFRLEYLPDEVRLEVRDFGGRVPVDNSLSDTGSGYGLRGMRERAELLGGELDAGPAEEGFVVCLRVPG
jgi:signal transduction histidine kinase